MPRDEGSAANLTRLSGRLLERGELRYTPAGVPAIEFRLGHVSEQIEADKPRRVECEMACVALGTMAQLVAGVPPGAGLEATGFLAAKSLRNRANVLHVQRIEFVEENQNGFQTEDQTQG